MSQEQKGQAFVGANAAPRAVVVEDDSSLSLHLRYNLEPRGYLVETIANGDDVLPRLAEKPADILILEWDLPGTSGLEICGRLRDREATRRLPIILLTTRPAEADCLKAYATGVDDYVVKPFFMSELVARMRNMLRRSRSDAAGERLQASDIELDRATRRVRRGDREIHLGPQDFRILEYMLERPGRLFSREQLLKNLWREPADIASRVVDIHVNRIRRALREGEAPDPIRAVRGTGYMFDANFAIRAESGGVPADPSPFRPRFRHKAR